MTCSTPTIPEAPETIEAQLRWLDQGKRQAVFLPAGSVLPRLDVGYEVVALTGGLLVYRSDLVSWEKVCAALEADRLGDLLGYGVPAKPDRPEDCVVIRDAAGLEKQSVVVDAATRQAALDAAAEVKDETDTVSVEAAELTITGRLNALQRRECVLRPYNPDVHCGSLSQLQDKHPDGFAPLAVTHVVMRGRDVIGWVGINSLPFYRLNIPVLDVSVNDVLGVVRVIENQYRMAGARDLATLLDVRCRCYTYKERLAYLEMDDWRIALKTL